MKNGTGSGTDRMVSKLLGAGLEHHRASRLEDAADCYSRILEQEPSHPDALNLLGVIARQKGDLDRAERLIGKAISVAPRVATYHHQLGRVYALRRRHAEAAESYRRALALDPGDGASKQGLAQTLTELGQHEQAAAMYRELLRLSPDQPELYFSLGRALKAQEKRDEAVKAYHEAAERFPQSSDAHFNLAQALAEAGREQEAVESYLRVLALKPEDFEAYTQLGALFHQAGEHGKAQHAYYHALRVDPDFVPALSNLGVLFMDLGELGRAEALLRRAIELDPEFPIASSNLAAVLSKQGRMLEAIEFFQRVLMKDASNTSALCSLGYLFDKMGEEESARRCYELTLGVNPSLPTARFNLSTHLLLDGNFAEGWAHYEQRRSVPSIIGARRPLLSPMWQGEPVAGRSLFVFAEQGFGDTLQFVRYLPLLAEQGARVSVEVQPELLGVLRDLHPSVHVFAKGAEEPPAADWHCPLLSLPSLFHTDLASIPAEVPYLRAESSAVERWAPRMGAPGPRIGLVWSGNPKHSRDAFRSLSFEQMRPLLGVGDASFFSLQKGLGMAQAEEAFEAGLLCNLGPDLHDFTDTTAALAHLDLLITVDTAVAHLAGAMGKPVWILVSEMPDWRWLRDRSDSPWYPTARLFRRSKGSGWSDLIAVVQMELAKVTARVGSVTVA